tara:strand:- start:110 stop:358 length:249 start_codon:yes stop_codon:yes gene_type:complete
LARPQTPGGKPLRLTFRYFAGDGIQCLPSGWLKSKRPVTSLWAFVMPITETGHRTHLQRLIKGALLVTIFILYVALVPVQFY